MKIDLVLAAPRLWLQSDQCWLLGMIVYELVTNAARHAFPDGNGGIRVELLRAGKFVECRVLDNGSAAANFQPGRGLKIVDELTKALDGRFDQEFRSGGSASTVVFPFSGEPQVAANVLGHHHVAGRRHQSEINSRKPSRRRMGKRGGANFSCERQVHQERA